MNTTIKTIVDLSERLIKKPAEEHNVQEFIDSALLYIEILNTLIVQLSLDNQTTENHNENEK